MLKKKKNGNSVEKMLPESWKATCYGYLGRPDWLKVLSRRIILSKSIKFLLTRMDTFFRVTYVLVTAGSFVNDMNAFVPLISI